MELDYRYKLDIEKDLLFILLAPRDALWLQRFKPGDEIVACHDCRKIFYSDDWNGQCPLCSGAEPLYFLRANHLLARDVRFEGNTRIEYPLPARRVRHVDEPGNDEQTLLARVHEFEERLDRAEGSLSEMYVEEVDALKRSSLTACAVFTGLSLAYTVFKAVIATI